MRTREISWRHYRDARSIPGLDIPAAAKIALAAHGIYPFDRIPDFRKESYKAPGVDFVSMMRRIPGKMKLSHPSLEGMEFDQDDLRRAVAALREADKSLFISDHHGTPKEPGSKLVGRLIASGDFRAAAQKKDMDSQLRISLEALTLEIWVYNHITRAVDPDEAERIVEQDMSDARYAIAEIRKGHTDTFLTSALHDALARNPQSSAFILAMHILSEHRRSFGSAAASEGITQQLDVSEIEYADATEDSPETTQQLDVSEIEYSDAAEDSPETTQQLDVSDLEMEGEGPTGATAEPDHSGIMEEGDRTPGNPRTVPGLADADGECDSASQGTRHDVKQMRKELRSDMDRIIALVSSIPEERRHLIAVAAPLVDWLLHFEWCDTSGVEIRIPDLFEDDPKKEMARKYFADLAGAIIAYENSLRKLAAMDPAKPVGQVEKEVLLGACAMAETRAATDLIVDDWLLQNYYGPDYVPARDLQALSLMKALGAAFPDSGQELFGMLVIRRSPSQAEATLKKSLGILVDNRRADVQKRGADGDPLMIALRDISEAREALSYYHSAMVSGRPVEERVPIAYRSHVERISAACNTIDGMTPGIAAMGSIEHMRMARDKVDAASLPAAFKPATALLLHNYSRQSVVALATELVDGSTGLELPSVNDPFDNELESLLPEGTDARTERIRQAARMLNLCAFAIMPLDSRTAAWGKAHPEGFSYTTIMAHSDGETGYTRIPTEGMMKALTQADREMIARVMGVAEFDGDALFGFMNLRAGFRELQLRNFAASAWTEGNWREDVARYETARREIYAKCNLPHPSKDELRAALCDPSSLSEDQEGIIASFFGLSPGHLTPQDINAFGIWLRGEPEALATHWACAYLDPKQLENLKARMFSMGGLSDPENGRLSDDEKVILAKILGKRPESLSREDMLDSRQVQERIEELSAFRSKWFSKDKDERLSQWRSGMAGLGTAANMAHKLRFVPRASYTREESELLVALSGRRCPPVELTPDELDKIRAALAKHVSMKGTYYQPPILALSAFSEQLDTGSLLIAARRQAMFNTILDAFSVERTDVRFGFDDHSFVSRAKNDGSGASNEDSCSSVHLILGDGSTIILDAVFDGVGGGRIGEVEGRSNGERASAIAKSVFEISAAAGWISTPEDVRRTLVMADLAIVAEQFRSKLRPDEKRENDMATTATVTFIRSDAHTHANEFYGIHAGDSVWKVMRKGTVVMGSRPHDTMFELLCSARSMVKDEWRREDRRTEDLDSEDQAAFDLAVESKAELLGKTYRGVLAMGAVVSALGDPEHIHINNADSDPVPFLLEEGDLVINASDGLHKRVCDHEIDKIYQEASKDVMLASRQLQALAEGRMPRRCECAVSGVEDDKTFVLRRVESQ